MANLVEDGVFDIRAKFVDDNNNLVMFDWVMNYPVTGAITPLELVGTQIVKDPNLTVDSDIGEYFNVVRAAHIADYFDGHKQFFEQVAEEHLIRETATEIL